MSSLNHSYLIKDFIFDSTVTTNIEKEIPTLCQFPAVYIIYSQKKSKIYIGETTNILQRLKQHLSNSQKKQLKNIKIIFSAFFNKSAVIDIESNIIKYISGDNKFILLNGNEGISNHLYYQKDEYYRIFNQIWNDLKISEFVNNDILSIENSNLFKYSPYKELRNSQINAINKYFDSVIQNSNTSMTFIEGSAGTGKTILAIYLIKLLLSETLENDLEENSRGKKLIKLANNVKRKMGVNEKLKIALVVPMTSLRATLKEVFKSIHGLSASMVIGPSGVKNKHFDLIIVDEAHRLCRRKNISHMGSFGKTNEFFGLDKEKGTQLDWILRTSERQIFFYDEKQSIRPSDIPKKSFQELKKSAVSIKLESQLRVLGGVDYINFVDDLLDSKKTLKKWYSEKYELKLFRSLKDMLFELKEKENKYGLCRTISGYSWKWISKDSNKPDVTIEGMDLYWNKVNANWINSTTSLHEMGCIHTTQGYDLNYTGIIFGSEITYDNEKIQIISENYYDRNGKVGISEIDLYKYIINIYKTIMLRGIQGTYIYCHDDKLREYFKKFMNYKNA